MVRAPAVAGRFYPGEPEALENLVATLLAGAGNAQTQHAIAVLAPHAGYAYSGLVAGALYASVQVPERIVLLGPNHTGLGPALSLWDRGDWDVPGGSIPIDEEAGEALKDACPELIPDHAAHRYEHCLEVQLPFLRARTQRLRITPIVVGTTHLATLESLGHAVAAMVSNSEGEVLVVISSDMTHYEPAALAWSKDRLALAAMEAIDPEELYRVVRREAISMCGFAPAVAGLVAARALGARSGRLVRYAHSGQVSGDDSSVVGYAGMVFL